MSTFERSFSQHKQKDYNVGYILSLSLGNLQLNADRLTQDANLLNIHVVGDMMGVKVTADKLTIAFSTSVYNTRLLALNLKQAEPVLEINTSIVALDYIPENKRMYPMFQARVRGKITAEEIDVQEDGVVSFELDFSTGDILRS